MAIALPAAWSTVSNACISTPAMVSSACAAGRQATPYRPAAAAGYRGRASGASTQGADAGHAAFSPFGLVRWQATDMPQTNWLDLFTVKSRIDNGTRINDS